MKFGSRGLICFILQQRACFILPQRATCMFHFAAAYGEKNFFVPDDNSQRFGLLPPNDEMRDVFTNVWRLEKKKVTGPTQNTTKMATRKRKNEGAGGGAAAEPAAEPRVERPVQRVERPVQPVEQPVEHPVQQVEQPVEQPVQPVQPVQAPSLKLPFFLP